MSRKPLFFIFGLLSLSCQSRSGIQASSPTEALPSGRSCHVPTESDAEVFRELVPILLDEHIMCLVWRPDEGDGRHVRFVRSVNGVMKTLSVHLDLEKVSALKYSRDKVLHLDPAMSGRKVWIFCSVLEDGKI